MFSGAESVWQCKSILVHVPVGSKTDRARYQSPCTVYFSACNTDISTVRKSTIFVTA